MTNSHEVITLETMAQCLADARSLLRDGDMCASTYVSLLEEAARLIRSVLAFAQDAMLDIQDGEETEAYEIVDRFAVVQAHRNSTCFQGGDFDLYLDLQNPGGAPTMVCESGADDKLYEPVNCFSLTQTGKSKNFNNLKAYFDSHELDGSLWVSSRGAV